jgi:putative oxidoreductase
VSQEKAKDITLFLQRVVAGLLMMQAGGGKIWDWFGGIPAEHGGHPKMFTQIWIGGVLEFWLGLAVMVGLFTRFGSFLLSGTMAVAYFQFHQPGGRADPAQAGVLTAARRSCGGAGRIEKGTAGRRARPFAF